MTMTTVEVAKLFHVGRVTIYNWETKGLLKPVMVTPTGRKYFDRDEVMKLYDSCFKGKEE